MVWWSGYEFSKVIEDQEWLRLLIRQCPTLSLLMLQVGITTLTNDFTYVPICSV